MASGESLWSPAFKGYLGGSTGLVVGDALVVQIDASSSLTFASSTTDSKNLTLDFTGGQAGDLFSFLPQVRTSGSLSTGGKDSLSLTASFPVLVTAVAADGTAAVQGSRSIIIQGKNESITVSGSVPPRLVSTKGAINFSQLANARLSYTTLISSANSVLAAADLQTVTTPAATSATPTTAGGATVPAAPAATATTAGAAPQVSLVIPDARKKELLLQYLNRLLDVIFAP